MHMHMHMHMLMLQCMSLNPISERKKKTPREGWEDGTPDAATTHY